MKQLEFDRIGNYTPDKSVVEFYPGFDIEDLISHKNWLKLIRSYQIR